MTAMLWFLLAAALGITFANGANDNFKGVATLYGSGSASYRRALAWATVTTLAGSLTAVLLAGSLVARFSGKGLVPDALIGDAAFLAAVGGGAAVTVLLATRLGFPVSTTHALTGALVGAGLVAAGGGLRLGALGAGFLAPLLASPLCAAALVAALLPLARAGRRALGLPEEVCVCVPRPAGALEAGGRPGEAAFARAAAPALPIVVAPAEQCRIHGMAGATGRQILDAAHFVSAGAVGFARGVNDTPKLLALLLPVTALTASSRLPMTAVAMALGGLLGARRVAETLGHKVTAMTPSQGFGANVVTAALVLFASRLGLPVSTTHVSTGALFGLGAVSGGARWRTVGHILAAWVITLPCAATAAALLMWASG